MSAQETVVEETGDPQVEAEARKLGWVPQEEFRGDKTKWIDASEFVERGQRVLPFVKMQNKRLEDMVARQARELEGLKNQLNASKKDFDEMREVHREEIIERVAEAKKQIRAQMKDARANDDVDREMDLREQLDDLTASEKAAKTELEGSKNRSEPGDDSAQTVEIPPEVIAWQQKYPQFNTDPDFTDQVLLYARKVKRENPTLTGQPFLDAVSALVDGEKGGESPRKQSKVEGGRGGSGVGRTTNGRTYESLPAEAKAVCDKQAARMVRADGKFKDVQSYRKYYVEELERTGYFND